MDENIEKLREKLNKLVDYEEVDLFKGEILKVSQELDDLLNLRFKMLN